MSVRAFNNNNNTNTMVSSSAGNRGNMGGTSTSGSYTFETSPRSVPVNRGTKKKYRDRDAESSVNSSKKIYNMMNDSRIRRGTTVPAPLTAHQIELQKQEDERIRKEELRKQRERLRLQQDQKFGGSGMNSGVDTGVSTLPVSGRQHMEIQTESYLEEISDRAIEKDMSTQTDSFMERPPTPKFIPAKTGIDVSTQIDPELVFNFDDEVEPILSVLIAKTLEQSMMEVREEEELANMKKHQEEIAAIRAAELVKTQQLEAEEKRKELEKERRIQQERVRLQKQIKLKEKQEARQFAQKYLKELTPSVFDNLTNQGFFYDPVQREVEISFMPWLLDQVDNQLTQQTTFANKLLDDLILNTLNKGKVLHDEAIKIEKEEEEKKQKLIEEQKQREQEELTLQQERRQKKNGDDNDDDYDDAETGSNFNQENQDKSEAEDEGEGDEEEESETEED